MITRENLKLLVVAVACLLVAWTGPAIAHGVHAKFAHNADKVDGKHAVGAGADVTRAKGKLVAHNGQGRLPARFIPNSFVTEGEHKKRHARIVTTHGHAGWHALGTTSTLYRETFNRVPASSIAVMPLQAPSSVGQGGFVLDKVEVCYFTQNGGAIFSTRGTDTAGSSETPFMFQDGTRRSAPAGDCYSVPVGKRVLYGANIFVSLAAGGEVNLQGVRATWSRASADVAP